MQNTKQRKFPTRQDWLFLPVYFLLILVPQFVAKHEFVNPLAEFPWYPSGNSADLFLYWKSIGVIMSAAAITALLAWYQTKEYHSLGKKTWMQSWFPMIPLLLYGILALGSALFSEHTSLSFQGTADQFEPVWALLSYVAITAFAYFMIRDSDGIKRVMAALAVGCLLTCLICVGQYFEWDFYQWLFRGKGYQFNFSAGRVYGPFYNPNYVGSYSALMIPIFVLLLAGAKNLWVKLGSLVLVAALIISLVGSLSTTGFVITIAMAVPFLFFFRKKLWQYRIATGGILVVALIAGFLGRDLITDYYVSKVVASFESLNHETPAPDVTSIKTKDDEVILTYRENQLHVGFAIADAEIGQYSFMITDDDGNLIANTIDEASGSIILSDERFVGISVAPFIASDLNNMLSFAVTVNGKAWNFTNQAGDGTYYHITPVGKLDKVTPSPSVLFTNNGRFASGRGYIWAKTIPLLKDYIILGSGPDTFTAVFPNDDYVDAYNNGYGTSFVTRPHNMYLQMAVQTGVLSVFAILVFYGIYAINSIRIYWKRTWVSWEEHLGLGIFLGTTGYMLTGFINDSSITVAPVFWFLIGLGMGINRMLSARAGEEA